MSVSSRFIYFDIFSQKHDSVRHRTDCCPTRYTLVVFKYRAPYTEMIVVVSLRNLPRLPVCGCLLVPRPPIYVSSIHNATCDFLQCRARVIKVCVFLRRTPPSFLEKHNSDLSTLKYISCPRNKRNTSLPALPTILFQKIKTSRIRMTKIGNVQNSG